MKGVFKMILFTVFGSLSVVTAAIFGAIWCMMMAQWAEIGCLVSMVVMLVCLFFMQDC